MYWVKQNEANETNYFDGDYWTYNSKRAFAELFPYMSERQVRTALDKLIDSGLIKAGNYNKLSYDRTLWYALTQKGKSIGLFDTMHMTSKSDASDTKVRTIPNINTAITSNVNADKKKERKKSTTYDAILANVTDDSLRDLYYEYIKMRKLIKSPMTDRALVMLINKVVDLEPNSIERQKQMLETAIMNNWKSVYPLKGDKQQHQGTGNIFMDMLIEEGCAVE